jgi:PIN domain nuclease of toxin-antitoxin system
VSARPILLDTCAALWISDEGRLKPAAEEALQAAQRDGTPIYLSPITAWEIGLLVSRGRLVLAQPPGAWFRAFTEAGFRLAELTPTILIESSFLPGPALRDPADRIIASTARAFGYRLMTRDRPLLAFAESGHVTALAC